MSSIFLKVCSRPYLPFELRIEHRGLRQGLSAQSTRLMLCSAPIGREHAMKNSNKCPKCQSREIVKIPPAGAGNTVRLGIWNINGIPVTRYLCGSCGYIEQWIDAAEDIERIKDYYGIVSPHQVSPRQVA